MSLRTELDAILTTMPTIATKSADAPLTELDWNSITENIAKIKEALTKIKDLPSSTIPKGFLYVRFPGRPLPYGADGVFNWTSEADWKKIHDQYAGDFLRLAGGNASTFKAESEQIQHDEKCKDKDNKPNTGGGQMDAVQDHTHCLYVERSQTRVRGGSDHHVAYYGNMAYMRSGRSDIETRPTNITVEMYLYNPQ